MFGCSLFDHRGDLKEEYFTKVRRDESDQLIRSISVRRDFYYNDLLIYDRQTNELIGSKIQLKVPEFLSFENWKKICEITSATDCDQNRFQREKSLHETNPRWTRSAYDITLDDPKYYTLETEFSVTQSSHHPVQFVTKEGNYKKYISTSTARMDQTIFITNKNHNRMKFSEARLTTGIKFLDNPASYSLTMYRGIDNSNFFASELTTSLVCIK
jgi:hypothetical protein